MATGTQLPVICNDCGALFTSGNAFAFGPGATAHMQDVSVGPCPHCGAMGSIPDGTYRSLGETAEYFASHTASPEHLRVLRTVLAQARDQGATQDETATAVDEALPGQNLGDAIRKLPESASALFWLQMLTILVMFLAIAVAHYDATHAAKPITSTDVQEMIAQAANAAAAQPPPAPPKPFRRQQRIGRNDPCPCGSGEVQTLSRLMPGSWVRRCLTCQTIDTRRTWEYALDAQLDRSIDTKKYLYSTHRHWYCPACGGRKFLVIEQCESEPES